MYIPLRLRSPTDTTGAVPAPSARWGSTSTVLSSADTSLSGPVDDFRHTADSFIHRASKALSAGLELRRRDGVQEQNTTIGVVVGVLLAVFLIAVGLFVYRYRFTIQLTHKKKHRHHSGSSKSSKTSGSSASSDAAAPAG